MRKKTNKKALIYDIGLFLVMMFVFGSITIVLRAKQIEFDDYKVGEKQYQLVDVYQKVEDKLSYMDMIARQKLAESIVELGKRGGFSEGGDCGKHEELNMWTKQKGEKDVDWCVPYEQDKSQKGGVDELAQELLPILKDSWSRGNPEKELYVEKSHIRMEYLVPPKKQLIPVYTGDNPSVAVKDGKVEFKYISLPRLNVDLFIWHKPYGGKDDIPLRRDIGKYSVKPSFRESVDYSFSEYEVARRLAGDAVDVCSREEEGKVAKCLYQVIKNSVKVDGKVIDTFRFKDKDCKEAQTQDLKDKSDRKYSVCVKSRYSTVAGYPNIKFAIYVPDRSKPDVEFGGFMTGGMFNLDRINDVLSGKGFEVLGARFFPFTNQFSSYFDVALRERFGDVVKPEIPIIGGSVDATETPAVSEVVGLVETTEVVQIPVEQKPETFLLSKYVVQNYIAWSPGDDVPRSLLEGCTGQEQCNVLISLDGTDTRTQEPESHVYTVSMSDNDVVSLQTPDYMFLVNDLSTVRPVLPLE